MAKKRALVFAIAVCATTATGCSESAAGPPRLPLHWVDFRTYESSVVLDADGHGSVARLAVPTSTGADCSSSDVREYSGSIEWHMVSDYQARMSVDGVDINVRVKGSFGEPDWSEIYLNACSDDPDRRDWTTFVGGTGP